MRESLKFSASAMPASKSRKSGKGKSGTGGFTVIDAAGRHYKELNEEIYRVAGEGARKILLQNVRGQRYIGTRLQYEDLYIRIEGVPGEDLGFNLSGPTIEVMGPAQNAVANTMDKGTIIVHGLGGDALAYGMRGGKLFVRDDVGYRVGIHMKEYKEKVPVVVIGGSSGDYLGEYMAGGVLILLNRNGEKEMVAGHSDKTLATGIHGGVIYLFDYDVPFYLPGIGAQVLEADKEDSKVVEPYVKEFAAYFDMDYKALMNRSLVKVVPQGSRPFAKFYYPAYPSNTGLIPEHKEKTSPCEESCPAGVPTGRFLRHLRLGEADKAIALLDEVTPLRYSCCGFICPHICMQHCTRQKVDFAVRTAELAKHYRSDTVPEKKANHKEKIAVIGAGPAGLSAAYQLAVMGYKVTVIDEADRPGGKMYQVISRSRLPLEDLEFDLNRIKKLGIEFKLNTRVDAAFFKKLKKDYDYIVVAVGAQKPLIPPVKGAEHLRPGLEFLKAANKRTQGGPDSYEFPVPGEKLAFIGGGDAAVDGIESAIELGVSPGDITVIDVKKPSADAVERKKLEKEGVLFRYPLFLQEATAKEAFVKNGAGNIEAVPATKIYVFINEKPQLDFLPGDLTEELDERGFFKEDADLPVSRTGDPRIFVVGDSRGLGLVTTNIGRGRRCAEEIDAAVQGYEYRPEEKETLKMVHLLPQRSAPVSEADAELEEEFGRCLHCGICVQCDECVESCPREALKRDGTEFTVDKSLCGGCGTCAATCPGGVIEMIPK